MTHREITDVGWVREYDRLKDMVGPKSSILTISNIDTLERVILSGEEGGEVYVVTVVFAGNTFQFVTWDFVDVRAHMRPGLPGLFRVSMPVAEQHLPEYYRKGLDSVYQHWLLLHKVRA